MIKRRYSELVEGIEFCAFLVHEGWEIVCWPAGTLPLPTAYRQLGTVRRRNRRFTIDNGHEYARLPQAIRALYDLAPIGRNHVTASTQTEEAEEA